MREMKDSRISWIGAMPANWQTGRIKDVIGVLTDYTANGSFGDLAKNVTYLDYEDYARLVRLTDLRENLQNAGVYVDEDAYEYLGKSKLFGGEILVANVGAYAGLFCEMPQPNMPATLGPNMYLIRTNNVMEAHYLYYLGNTSMVQEQLKQKAISSAQPKLNKTDVKTVYISIPSVPDQHRISTYLDAKCAEIDALTADIQSQIDTLEQYKRSVITEAVTKGLNRDVEMKESGIEWINKIPISWNVTRLKYVLKEPMKYGATESGIPYEESLPRYIRITDITSDGKLKDDGKLSLNEEVSSKYLLQDKTLLFARSGGTVGKAFLYRKEYGRAAFAGYLISAITDSDKVLPEWLYYYVNSSAYWEWVSRIFTQATIQNIGADKYSDMPLPICSDIDMQRQIIKYLDAKCGQIDTLISEKQDQLSTLNSYKKSLIYEYVTGKKEVPAV